MCESLSKGALCSLCLGAGLMRPGHACPLCAGCGYRSGVELVEQTVTALSRAASYYGGPASLTLDELHERWRAPAPNIVRNAVQGCEDARARLRAAGLACAVVGASIEIELLARTKREEPS